jgi:hypothetical protein
MGWIGARGALLGGVLIIAWSAAAGVGAARPQTAVPAVETPHARVCNSYEADYVAGTVHLTFTRTGHYLSPRTGITVAAKEVDVVSPAVDRRDHVKLQVETVCGTGEVRFLDEARTGTSQLTGSWTEPTPNSPTPKEGTCRVRRARGRDMENPPFRLWVKRPNRGGYNAFFRPGDKRVGMQFTVAAPDGLLCRAPLPAPMVYPYAGINVLPSAPVTLPLRALQRDRRFTVALSGSSGPRKVDWQQAEPGATAVYSMSWKGSITFTPAGCTHYVFSSHAVRVLHDCL